METSTAVVEALGQYRAHGHAEDNANARRVRPTFATRQFLSAEELHVSVKGIGRVEFPVSAETVKKLVGKASLAKFGLKEKTLFDPNVRDTWEVPLDLVKVDDARWQRALERPLLNIKEKLGMRDAGELRADLFSMLVYEPGQFFVAHQDSEKCDEMVGTLLVTLPSKYEGGIVTIELREQRTSFRPTKRNERELSLVAFFSHCHHAISPIKSGYRVVLVYNLLFRGNAIDGEPAQRNADAALQAAMSRYFSTPTSKYDFQEKELPDQLVYLLDHEYSERGLGWSQLKGIDRQRAAAMRRVAESSDYEIYLTLADVFETWSCEVEGYGWDYHHERGEVSKDANFELLDFIEGDFSIRHWIDRDGHHRPELDIAVSGSSEVCFSIPSSDLDPFRQEYEGWMGNYGNTLDRWYHRAAIVMWPKARTFVIQARANPQWALRSIIAELEANRRDKAKTLIETILPFWQNRSHPVANETLPLAIELAQQIDNAEIAHSLLAPFSLEAFDALALARFSLLPSLYGLSWAKNVCQNMREQRYGRVSVIPHQLIPAFCEQLLEQESRECSKFATWLVEQTHEDTKATHARDLAVPEHPSCEKGVRTYVVEVWHLIEACQIIAHHKLIKEMVTDLLDEKRALSLSALLHMLRSASNSKRITKDEGAKTSLASLDAIRMHCLEKVKTELAKPPRGKNDWSISLPGGCRCELCGSLRSFLEDPDRQHYEWPITKAKRQHVHQRIDEYKLPVTHETRRKGSPYTLVLKKKAELFDRDKKLRRTLQRDLSWLEKMMAR